MPFCLKKERKRGMKQENKIRKQRRKRELLQDLRPEDEKEAFMIGMKINPPAPPVINRPKRKKRKRK